MFYDSFSKSFLHRDKKAPFDISERLNFNLATRTYRAKRVEGGLSPKATGGFSREKLACLKPSPSLNKKRRQHPVAGYNLGKEMKKLTRQNLIFQLLV